MSRGSAAGTSGICGESAARTSDVGSLASNGALYPPAHPHLPPPAKSCEQSAVDLTVTPRAIPSQQQQLVQARLRLAAAELLQDVADVLPWVADSGQLAAANHSSYRGVPSF